MFRSKIFLWLLFLTLLVYSNYGQSFTYSGPSQVTIPYGSTTTTATFYFTYNNLDSEHKVIYPMLNIKVDGVKLNTYDLCNSPQTPSSYGISLTPGIHTISFTLMSVNWYTLNCYDYWIWQESQVTVNCKFQISVENIFGGGTIYAEGNRTSPFYRTSSSGDNVSLGAIEQNYGGYNYIWSTSGSYPSDWRKESSGSGGSSFSNSQSTSYSIQSTDLNTSLVAGLRKVCGLTFQANSSMSINGNYRTSPYTESVVEQNSISAIASSYSANGIDYTFSKWSTGSGDAYSPITASEHKTYTAVYIGKPNSSECSITFNNSEEGQPVRLSWSKHPQDNATISHYAIYRKVTSSGTPNLLTTVSASGASSYSYTDYEFAISSGANKILLFYDVRPYYSPNNSYSDPSFEAVYGVYNISKQPDELTINQTNFELPSTLNVSNYPNPFNPTTTITYQLPEKSFVTIKVFDILGKEVATLVNETKPAGYYTVNFDASHSERGRGMTSGVYIYTISANGIVLSKKMLLTK